MADLRQADDAGPERRSGIKILGIKRAFQRADQMRGFAHDVSLTFFQQLCQSGTKQREGDGMAWIYLVIAGLLEVVWSFSLKQSDGLSRPGLTVFTIVTMLASVWFLSLAMRSLPLGTAYVIWTGIGALGAFLLGIGVLGESADPLRLMAAGLILAGLLLLKFATPH